MAPEVTLFPFDVNWPPTMMMPFHMLEPEIVKSLSAMMVPWPGFGSEYPFV